MIGAVCAILAAGASTRAGVDKVGADLGGRPVLAWSIAAARASGAFDRIVIVTRPDRPSGPIEAIARAAAPGTTVVAGGGARAHTTPAGPAPPHDAGRHPHPVSAR